MSLLVLIEAVNNQQFNFVLEWVDNKDFFMFLQIYAFMVICG